MEKLMLRADAAAASVTAATTVATTTSVIPPLLLPSSDSTTTTTASDYGATDIDPNGDSKRMFQFDSNYGRTGFIWRKKKTTCDGCRNETVTCLAIDSSEGEYGPGVVCLHCIHKILYQ